MDPSGGDKGTHGEQAPAGGWSPIHASAVALALVLIAGAAFFLTTRADQDPTVPIAEQTIQDGPSEAEPLTEAEAIAAFRLLDQRRLKMYADRDVSLISAVLDELSPLRPLARTEIERLLRNNVLVRTRYEHLSLEVVRIDDSGSVEVRQVLRQYPKFIDEDGREVTATRAHPVRKTITWILRPNGMGNLRIFNSTTENVRRIKGQ